MKSFNEFLAEGESRRDALKRALAISKWKKAGGKVEKQPPSPSVGSKKYRGRFVGSPKTKEDEKMAKDIQKYRKKKKMKKQLKHKVWYK